MCVSLFQIECIKMDFLERDEKFLTRPQRILKMSLSSNPHSIESTPSTQPQELNDAGHNTDAYDHPESKNTNCYHSLSITCTLAGVLI